MASDEHRFTKDRTLSVRVRSAVVRLHRLRIVLQTEASMEQ